MSKPEVRQGLRYTKDHEWAKLQNGDVLIGISSFAVSHLGDITLVNIDVDPGDQIIAGKSFGTIESVKTLSDLFGPVDGSVVRINVDLEERPELINEDCYAGWMISIMPMRPEALDELMDAAEYTAYLESSAH